MPYDVNVQDLDTALRVVEGANAPNGGLAIDTWHMASSASRRTTCAASPARHLGGWS